MGAFSKGSRHSGAISPEKGDLHGREGSFSGRWWAQPTLLALPCSFPIASVPYFQRFRPVLWRITPVKLAIVVRTLFASLCLALGLPALVLPSLAHAQWPQFRGPEGQGHTTAKNLPLNWSDTENVVWRTPLTGKGWSSPVIEGNQIWMTAAIESPDDPRGTEEAAGREHHRRSRPWSWPVQTEPASPVRRSGHRASCCTTSRLLTEDQPDPIHSLNSFASPTPVIEKRQVVLPFRRQRDGLSSTRRTQKVLWVNRKLKIKHENGPGSSPVLWNNLLIVHCDGSDVQYPGGPRQEHRRTGLEDRSHGQDEQQSRS